MLGKACRYSKIVFSLLAVNFCFHMMAFAEESSDAAEATGSDTEIEHIQQKITANDLLEFLKKKGLLNEEQVQELMSQTEENRKTELENRVELMQPEPGVVAVPHVPEFVKNQIRDEVRMELREEVVKDVLGQAKQERWGVPGVLPTWVDKIKLSGDIRLRSEYIAFDDANDGLYFDLAAVNSARSATTAILNTREDRARLRSRVRLNANAKVTNNLSAKIKLATGKRSDPISTNQTLGNYSEKYEISFDQAYLEYKLRNFDGYPLVTFYGGRMKNPWMSTDLVWDSDLAFEGVAMKFKFNLWRLSELYSFSDDLKTDETRYAFLTLGAFPIEEISPFGVGRPIESSSDSSVGLLYSDNPEDKWLYAFQLGTKWVFTNQSELTASVGYYDYDNVEGQVNELDLDYMDVTVFDAMTRGNTLVNIANPLDKGSSDLLLALGSDYNLVNFNFTYDYAGLAPIRVKLVLDYVRNIGYEEEDIISKATIRGIEDDVFPFPITRERTKGYQVKIIAGWPSVSKKFDWQTSFAYKELESDAVIDAFTDSDFRGGGTGSKGWVFSTEVGLTFDTSLSLTYISADEIQVTGLNSSNETVEKIPPYGQDTVQLDLKAQF